MKIKNIYFNKLIIEYHSLSRLVGLTLFIVGILSIIFLESTVFTSANLTCQRKHKEAIKCNLVSFTILGVRKNEEIINPMQANLNVVNPRKYLTVYKIIVLVGREKFSLLNQLDGDYEKK